MKDRNPIVNSQRRVALLTALFFAAAVLTAQAVNLVQEFYLPMPEQQIYTANNAIISGTGSTIASTFSIVVTGNGTVIYYDQWEDGYETDLSNPTQPTTQIWGDGNDAHGIPPGFAHNPLGLPAGTVITLTNNVPLPRNPSTILWDARDRIAANKALVVSRAGWPIPTGPVFAGAVGVLATIDYGTNYISPVGQNLTNNLFKYVGLCILAAQNNTTVTIDPNGNGVGVTNIVLNQGESYLVNGGILKGGRVTATKPIQADLLIGHVGASYASDWFTLYPVSAWSSAYYTPVGSAASGSQPAYVYLYNPGAGAITINYKTQAGSGSFSVPGTNGVYQFQMPVGSGASFASAGGQNFYALCTVAANNSSDTAYNWGFTLVPQGALTTEGMVGWGPGSADGTVDGSPVWVTALANTKLYVDYKGDHLGPLTDPSGSHYDTNFTVTALQSQKIFDPSKNQTGMRVYTVDGTLITAAWGEDPDTAQPGNPYIDAGTTVIPFPTPLLKKTAVIVTDTPPAGLSLGDVIQYTVEIDNKGLLPLGNTVVIDAPSGNLTYVTNSTTLNSNAIPDHVSGAAFPLGAPAGYTIPVILSQGVSTFQYLARVNAGGVVSNSVNIGGTTISTSTLLTPPPTNGAAVSLNFTDTNGVPVSLYAAGANVFVTMTNAVGNTSSNSVQAINVTVVDLTHGDLQTIVLTETGTNTGVFRNGAGLPTSATAGLGQQDGILNVAPGDTLSVSYTDPVYGDSASNTAAILVPTPNKQLYLSVNSSTNGTQDLNRIDPVAYGHGPIHTSVDLGSGGGAIALDSVTTVSNTALAATFSHTTSAGANRLMLVGVSLNRLTGGTTFEIPTNVTYAGIPLTLVGGRTNLTSQEAVLWIYALTNPPAGTANVVVTWDQTQTDGDVIGCATFTGVSQSTPYGAFYSNVGTSTAASLVVASAPGELVFDTVMLRSSDFGASGSPGANQTALWKTYFNSRVGAGASTHPGAASVTNTWTSASSADWSIGGISIKPAASGGTNVTSFVQTPSFALPFTMPSGGTVTITNFITITNGVLPANPAITATLQANGTNFITLTNCSYLTNNNTLVWSGQLATTVTVPAGQLITYVISNYQSTATFHVNYDSTNAPSVIVLPAATVIQVNTFGVYDAPFPGGNLVTAPVAGSTVYLRASVSDPFGSYDITSLGLAVTGPSPAASFTNLLTGANVVTNDTLSKTYEYPWPTGPTTGGYTLAVTAHEGTEGVTAAAAASITTTFLDLGTPSTTEFTGGNNGTTTNSYLAGSSVCVRVTDLNRNTNANTAQTIIATVSSSSGDSEILSLIETGTNTGVFTACINTSTNSGMAPNDGTLFAPVGSVLTASYSDPTDPTDNTSATATIQPRPGVPGVLMNKTIVSPSGGQVGVGQPVVYNLQIVNVGSTTLPSLKITDTFSSKLSYASASLAPDTVAAGTLTWNNLGAFTPGQSTNLTVTFTTLATGMATNSATANGSTATNSSSVILVINSAAVNVTKVLLSPTNQPVSILSNVVFRITVQNVGNTTVNYLPMEDTFSSAYYQFVSATIPPSGSGAGSLIWTNLASPVALATNAVITNDITMKVVGQGSPANNSATVDFATDIFGNPVPTSSSTIGVQTATASINGHVYDDEDQSSVYNPGDPGIANVTLRLFTDPNGDGDPADGVLVQITTTDPNGFYEFLNLNVGHYVIIENHLPGYDSTTPSSNQLGVNLATLTVSTNHNFFDYQPSPALYSTVSGRVWYDANGNGTNNLGETNIDFVEINLFQDVNQNGQVDTGEPLMGSVMTDANGNYSFAGVSPGSYVIRQTVPYGYYSTGASQGTNANQIIFVFTNGIVSTNNDFFDRLSPVAVADTSAALYQVPVTIYPLTNDLSPNGDALTITNATSTDGIVVINPGATNLTFTPTNLGATTITYTIADAHGGTNSAIISVNVTALADLAIGKTAAAGVFAASNLVYTISVTNFGPTPASSVVVTDALPAGITFVSASNGGVNNAGVVTWSLGDLTNGFSGNLTVTVTAPASGSLTNTAGVNSPTGDPNPANNTTSPVVTAVTPLADLAIAKTGPANVLALTNFSYSISVTNFGPSDASSVVVTDTLPAAVAFVSASGNGTNNAGIVTWNLGTLTSGQSSNFTVTVISPATGSLTNIANVSSPTGDSNLTNNITPPVTTVVTPVADLAIGKTGAAAGVINSNFNYTISVTNHGPSSAAGFVVTDSLPGGIVLVSSVPVVTTNAANQIIWTSLGGLANGATTNLTLTVQAVTRTNFANIATVGGSTLDNNLTNNTSLPVVTSITNRPPVVVNDTASTARNVAVTIPVLANDSDPDGDALTIISVSPTNGLAVISGTNIVFTPTNAVPGTDVFSYTITDGFGGTNSALITVFVTNRPPVAQNDSVSTPENVAVPVPVLANDSDPDGDALTIVSVSPTNGTAVISGTNVVFTPTTNFVGTATVGYAITDGFGGTNSALITVSVTNRPPVANPDSYAVTENMTNTFAVLTNDLVITPGGSLTIISVAPTNGTATIVNGTNVLFTPTLNFVGVATIGYSITDNVGGTNSSLVTVLVTNIPPVANPDSYTVFQNSTNTFAPLTNDLVRTPGGTLGIVGVNPTNGTATVSGTNIVFTPTPGFTGTATVGYTITDGIGGTNSSVITVTVQALADLAVGKTGPASVYAATNFNYTITVTNFGPGTAASLSVTDNLPSAVTFVSATSGATFTGSLLVWTNLGALVPGAATNLTVTVTAPLTGVSLTNVASAGSPTSDPNPTNNTSPPVATTVTTVADVSIVKSGPAGILFGTNYNYTIIVSNAGPSTATSLSVTDSLPAGLIFVSAVPAAATNASNQVIWSLGDVAAGAASNLTLTVISTQRGSVTNIATAGSPTFDPAMTNNVTPPVITSVTNNPPVANPDSYSMTENSTNTFSPLVNDIVRTPGGTLSVIAVSPTNGTATIVGGTNVTFTPAHNFFGVTTIGYTITDGIGGTNSSLITVTVTNSPPVAYGQSLATTENAALPVTLTGLDPSGLPLTFSIVGSPSGGTLTGLNTNTGVVTYTPTNNFTGTDNFTFRVFNGYSYSSNATVTVAVTPVADLLVAQSGPASGVAGSNLVFTVAVTNLGPAGATNIVVTNQIDSGFTFVSASASGGANGNLVTWMIPVLPANGATNLTMTLFAVEGGTFTNVASGGNATLDLNPANNNGSLTNAQVITTVSALADVAVFKTGGTNVLANGLVNYAITATNFGPSTASNVVVQDRLPAGAALQTASGNYSISNNVIVWAAATLAGGAATNFTVTLTAPASGTMTNIAFSTSSTRDANTNNNNGSSSNSTVTTAVTPVADLAIGKSGAAAGVINSNFNYTISVTNFGPSSAVNYFVTDSLPAGIMLVGAVPVATTNGANQVIWTNLPSLVSGATTNLTLTVQAVTRTTFTNIASVGGPALDNNPTNNTSLPVMTSITNRPPVAVNDTASTARNVVLTISVLANDSDPDGDALTIISVSPTNGIAVISGTNILFTPTNTAPGTDIFSYTITDGFGGTNSALITVSVTNRPPVAVNDSASTPENVAVTVPVLANDSDLDGDALTVVAVNPTNGTAVISGTNVVFTPATNFVGTATVAYAITDGFGGTNSALVTISVTNRPPVANPDSYAITENTTNTFAVLTNDFVVTPGGSLTIISVAPTNGTATIVNGTNIAFVPATNFLGTATIGYTITDNIGGTNTGLITVLVTNLPPLANPDSYTVQENSTNTLSPLTNDLVQTPGGTLTILSVSPTNGTASISGTIVVFTPALNFVGTATIGYTITDNVGGTNSSLITVFVTNLPPTAFGQAVSLTENMARGLVLTGSDPTSLPLTFVVVGGPANGALTAINTNTGAVTYTPNANFTGADAFTFQVNNGYSSSPTATVNLTVTNIPPLATPDSYTVLENSTNTFAPLVNDSVQTPGGNLSLVSASATNGTATFSGTNVMFTPSNNFTGTATIGYVLTDGIGGTNSSVITVTVLPVADLAVSKSGPATVYAATNFDYTITVTNRGPGAAASLSVTDNLPSTVSFVSATAGATLNGGQVVWADLGSLAAGATTNLIVTVTAPASGVNLTNLASGGSPTSDPNPTNNTSSPVFTTVTPVADLAIGKSGSAFVQAAGSLTYTISVTNFGPSIASGVVVTDALPAGVTFVSASGGGVNNSGVVNWSLGTLTNNQVTNVTVTVTAPASGTLTNIASVSSPTPDTNQLNNVSPPVLTDVTPVADVGVSKAGPAGIVFGTNFSYTISVTNFGPSTATGISVTDSLPAGLLFVSSTPETTTNAGNQVIWANLGNLAAGASTNLTVTVMPTASGTVTNLASGGSPTLDPNPTNNVAPPVVTVITKATPVVDWNPAGPIVYGTPLGTNQNNATSSVPGNFVYTATNGVVLPAGTNTLSVTFTATDTNYVPVSLNAPLVVLPAPLTVTASNVFRLYGQPNPALGGTVTGIQNADNLTASYATPATTNSPVGTYPIIPTPIDPNSRLVNYTVVTNNGTLTVNPVTPAANGQSLATTENTAKAITLTGSDPASLPLTFIIASAPANGVLTLLNTNTGTVTYAPNTNFAGADSFTFRVNNGQTNSAPATISLTVTPVADLVVVQSGPTNGLAGSNLVFTVSVTNRGPATATSLVISNQLAPGFTFVSASGSGSNHTGLLTWLIAALPANGATNLTVTAFATEGGTLTNVASGTSAVLDLNPANNDGSMPDARSLTVITPVADVAVFKDGGTNVYAGGPVNYTITASNAGPSTATGVVVQDTLPAAALLQSASGSYSVSNGVVTWPGVTLAPGTATTFNLTLLAPASVSSLVNIASGTATTADPNPANNNGSFAQSRVTTRVTPSADVVVLLAGPASALQGSNFVYNLVVTNAGPSTASNVVVADSLPTNLVFVAASAGGVNSNNLVTWPQISSLGFGGSTNYTVTVKAPFAGWFTNMASAFSATFDPNPTNNSGVSPASQAQTLVGLPQLSVIAGTTVLNRQDGLYEQTVIVTNTGSTSVMGVRLSVQGLPAGAQPVYLWNASGTNSSGVPYVQYNQPLNPGGLVSFALEFYNPYRVAFTNTFSVEWLAQVPAAPVVPTNGFISGVSIYTDLRKGTRIFLEFPTVIGRRYTVIYAESLAPASWKVAAPSFIATANAAQWYDDGPPKTVSSPLTTGHRFYRVIQN